MRFLSPFRLTRSWAVALLAVAGCTLVDLDDLSQGDDDGRGGNVSSVSSSAATGSTTSMVASTGSAQSGVTTASTTQATGTSSTSTGPASLLTDCVLLLRLDEDAWVAAGSVTDASSAGNNGTPVGLVESVAGKFGGGAAFAGSETIVVPNTPSLQATTALTYAAWVRADAVGGDPGILSKRAAFMDQVAFTLFISQNDNVGGPAWYADIESSRFNAPVLAEAGIWHHLAVVFDGALQPNERSRLYLDGVAVAVGSGPATMTQNQIDLTIGNLPGGGGFFSGALDEIAVWTRALTPAEVASIAQSNRPIQ